MMKFEKDVESGIASYMKSRACRREVAVHDLMMVGIGRVVALDKHAKRPRVLKHVGKVKMKPAKKPKKRS